MSERLYGSAGDPEKIHQVRQALEAERAPLVDLYIKSLDGGATRDERIRLRVDIMQRIKALRGEVWDKQEAPPQDIQDKTTLGINDLFVMMTQLEDQVAALRAKQDTSQ